MDRFSTPAIRGDRAAGMAFAVLLHVGLLLLLLTAAPRLISDPADPVLRVFDVPPVPPPPPPLPLPPEPVPQPPAVTDAGGGRRGAEPVRRERPAPAPLVVPDRTPVVDAPPAPVSMPVGSIGAVPGGDNGNGVAGQGPGSGSGIGDGSGDGDGAPDKAVKWARTRWIVRPSRSDFYANWPKTTLARRASGSVVLICEIAKGGRPRHCDVFAESPAGAGFGAAAIRMSPKFRIKPVQRDGKDADIPVLVPLEFRWR